MKRLFRSNASVKRSQTWGLAGSTLPKVQEIGWGLGEYPGHLGDKGQVICHRTSMWECPQPLFLDFGKEVQSADPQDKRGTQP